jgi:hypothetical protein
MKFGAIALAERDVGVIGRRAMHAELYDNPFSKGEPDADWKHAHEALVQLSVTQCAHDYEEARAIFAAFRTRAHVMIGCATFLEYLERVLGYAPRAAFERLRVAEALDGLPKLAAALREGVLKWSAVREISRIAVPETEAEWIEAARQRTIREVELLVSGHDVGDRPSDPINHRLRKRVLRFEVAAETHALVREAIAKIRRDAGGGLDDDDALFMMARMVLQGPKDEGRASYQIAVTRCPECKRVAQQGAGESMPVDSTIGEMAECDAQHVVMNNEAGPVADPKIAHVGSRPRATQTIPPSIRREVLRRDGGRCTVPGCRSAIFLDLHHTRTRAEGGDHDPALLTTLCGGHHRAVHDGRLLIEGSWTAGFEFRHSDGSRYGAGEISVARAAAMADAFAALIRLGYKEDEAKRALDDVRSAFGHMRTVEILRAALAVLREEEQKPKV